MKASARTRAAKSARATRARIAKEKGANGTRKKKDARNRTSKAPGPMKKGTTRSRMKKGSVRVRARPRGNDGPVVTVAIRELDPLRKCGPNTTVQFLYRVDESVDGRRTAHLVFFDRHGWYCEHGRACPAVGHAKKHNGRTARVS
ncbi:MAG: hypothetical protein ABI601_04150 [bacterium]